MTGRQLAGIAQKSIRARVVFGKTKIIISLLRGQGAGDARKFQQGWQFRGKGETDALTQVIIKRFDAEKIPAAQQGIFPRVVKGKGEHAGKAR